MGLLAVAAVSARSAAAPAVAPYGSWASPLSAEALAAGGIAFGDLRSADGRLYWTENVPARSGSIALFTLAGGVAKQVTPDDANVRTRVHEYGGAPFVVDGATTYYSQFSDQRLYALEGNGKPAVLTPPQYRYADCVALPGQKNHRPSFACARITPIPPMSATRSCACRFPVRTPARCCSTKAISFPIRV